MSATNTKLLTMLQVVIIPMPIAARTQDDHVSLVKQLNLLLSKLNISLDLISPTDLTPSLLIAILESLLDRRIPTVRSSNPKHSHTQNMKIFLGVLETDILQVDVGLSDVDPGKLASGEWDEVFFIAELLCWIGRQIGLLPPTKRKRRKSKKATKRVHTQAPEPCFLQDETQTQPPPPPSKSQLDLEAEALFQSRPAASPPTNHRAFEEHTSSSYTSASATRFGFFDSDDSRSDTLSALSLFDEEMTKPPSCIHQIPSPSLHLSFDGDEYITPPPPHPQTMLSIEDTPRTPQRQPLPVEDPTPTPTRTNTRHRTVASTPSFIRPVDEESEVFYFENTQSLQSSVLGDLARPPLADTSRVSFFSPDKSYSLRSPVSRTSDPVHLVCQFCFPRLISLTISAVSARKVGKNDRT